MLKHVVLLSLTALFLASCQSEEDTEPVISPIPNLEFKQIQDFKLNGYPYRLDSVVTTLAYTDGDADLGYEFSLTAGTVVPANFFLHMYVKRNGNFRQVIFAEPYGDKPIDYVLSQAPLDYAGQKAIVDYGPFKLITQGNKSGEIIHRFHLTYNENTQYVPGDTLKFSIYVVDRAMNKSNTVETSEFIF